MATTRKASDDEQETDVRDSEETGGDVDVSTEDPPEEVENEEDIASKDADLENMPDGMAAAHRIVSACHGMKDVLHGERNVEGPMAKCIANCKDVMSSLEDHVRGEHESNYGDHPDKKDLPAYDMDSGGDEGGGDSDEPAPEEEEAPVSAKSIIGKSFGKTNETDLDAQIAAAERALERSKQQLAKTVA